MSLSRIGAIVTVLLSTTGAYSVSKFSNSTTVSLLESTSTLSPSNTVSPDSSSYLLEDTSLLASTSGTGLIPLLSSTTGNSNPSSSSLQDTGYYITTEIETLILTWTVPLSETITYDNDLDTSTLTISPFTSTETETITTVLVKQYPNNATSSALPVWDADPYLSYFIDSSLSANASFAAEMSSFVSYGRQPACTAAYHSYLATAQVLTIVFGAEVITTTLPDNQVTEKIFYETITQASFAYDAYCCADCGYASALLATFWNPN